MERSQWSATFGLGRHGGDLGAFPMSCDFRPWFAWWRPRKRSQCHATFGLGRHGGDLGAFPMVCDFRPWSAWWRPWSVPDVMRLSAFVGMGATLERSQCHATFGLCRHGGDLGAFPMVCDFRLLVVVRNERSFLTKEDENGLLLTFVYIFRFY